VCWWLMTKKLYAHSSRKNKFLRTQFHKQWIGDKITNLINLSQFVCSWVFASYGVLKKNYDKVTIFKTYNTLCIMMGFGKKTFDKNLLYMMGYIRMYQYVLKFVHRLVIYLSNKIYF
jgi:hypothetical protein